MSPHANDVHLLAQNVLTIINAASTGVSAYSGWELPTRQVVRAGGAIYDCEQVCVAVVSIGTGIPEAANGLTALTPCGPVWNANLELSITRCASEKPGGARGNIPPTPDDIEADLAKSSIDAAVLMATAERIASLVDATFTPIGAVNGAEGAMISTTMTAVVPIWPDDLG